jgi:general secretion pathway protein D
MRFRPAFFLSALLAGFLWAPGFAAQAPDPSEVKIRLMADALTARDRGDYATAKAKLEALQAIAPNDPTVRRVLADVVARLNAPPPPPPRPVPPPPAPVVEAPPAPVPATVEERRPAPSVPGQVVMPVVHVEKSDAPEAVPADNLSPEARRAAAAAEALLHASGAPLSRVMSYVEAQRALARTQARDQDYAAAIATLDAALEELQRPVNELRAERRDYAAQKRELEREEERRRTGVRIRHKR